MGYSYFRAACHSQHRRLHPNRSRSHQRRFEITVFVLFHLHRSLIFEINTASKSLCKRLFPGPSGPFGFAGQGNAGGGRLCHPWISLLKTLFARL